MKEFFGKFWKSETAFVGIVRGGVVAVGAAVALNPQTWQEWAGALTIGFGASLQAGDKN